MSAFVLDLSHEELRDGVVVVKVVGEVDVYTFPAFRDYLTELLEREVPPRHVGFDMSEVPFWDSTALGVVVGFLKRFRRMDARALVAVVNPSERVGKIFRITGLTKVFPVVESAEALLELVEEERQAEAAGPEVEADCA